MPLEPSTFARLRSQVEQGDLILFTGAGFSLAASDRAGNPLPSVRALKEMLWDIALPSDPFDSTSSLGDVYEIAVRARRTAVADLLRSRFSVDPNALPPFYETVMNFPWRRVYTLNVDDLELAVASRFALRRAIRSLSALDDGHIDSRPGAGNPMEVVHLNGRAASGNPDLVTFSELQYAQRIANQEPFYSRCVTELASKPFVFIGTELREVPLWQHMELRRRRSQVGRDFRPTSILVTPQLDAARAAKLAALRIEWYQGTAEQFATEVLGALTAEAGRGFVSIGETPEAGVQTSVAMVRDLAAQRPKTETWYLLGAEPQWSDLIQGRAIQRSHETELLDMARRILRGDLVDRWIAVVGTSGSGKSTTLMSLGLKLSADGVPAFWVDRDSDVAPSAIRREVLSRSTPVALLIDDADLYGPHLLANLVRDLVHQRPGTLCVFAARSTRMDDLVEALGDERTGPVMVEAIVPHLTDADIDGLIAVLDASNRLGKLKGLSDSQRRQAFSSYAGRQLLVAMIEATSNERFEQKACRELEELSGIARYIYGTVCVASSLRFGLSKDEILLASGDDLAEAANSLDRLAARGLIVSPSAAGGYRARHRVIADLILDKLRGTVELRDIISGVLFACAAKLHSGLERHSRPWRLVIRLMNHELLLRLLQPTHARDVYAEVESFPVISGDYHYWLQRGSVEVESGDLRLAENFLEQARSLCTEDDYRIETEYAYMLLRKAILNPNDLSSFELVLNAVDKIDSVIAARGSADPHPFHLLGRCGLDWIAVSPQPPHEKRGFLDRVMVTVEKGVRAHPKDAMLPAVRDQLRQASLMTIVIPPNPGEK